MSWNRDAVYQILKYASKRRHEWIDGVDGEHSFPTEMHSDVVAAAEDLLEACEAALEYMPSSEVHNWPPGFELKKDAIRKCREAIRKAKRGSDAN